MDISLDVNKSRSRFGAEKCAHVMMAVAFMIEGGVFDE